MKNDIEPWDGLGVSELLMKIQISLVLVVDVLKNEEKWVMIEHELI